MENTLATILIVAFLLIGAVGGVILTPNETIEVPGAEVEVVTEVPVNVSIEVPVADVSVYLDQAVDDFMDYVDDEELFTCGDYEYNLDEISISRVYEDYSVAIDDEDTTVEFSIKLEYDEDDERSCKKVYDVKAYYEEDEDVEIEED